MTTTSRLFESSSRWAGLVLALSAAACTPPASSAPGTETGPCIDRECLNGLVCLSNLCVNPDADAGSDASPTSGANDSTPANDGTTGADSSSPTGAASTTRSTSPAGTTQSTDPTSTASTTNPVGTTQSTDPAGTGSSTGDGGPGETTEGSMGGCEPPPHVACDGDANNFFFALGVNCPGELEVDTDMSGSPAAMATQTGFGPSNAWDPTEGEAFAVLGSGFTVDLAMGTPVGDNNQSPTFCNDDLGASFDLVGGLPPPLDPVGVGGDCADDPSLIGDGDCSNSLGGIGGALVADYTELRITAQVPATVTSMSYDFAFLSTEYPAYVGSEFNDIHIAWLESERWTGNISVDGMGVPVSVNSELLDIRDDDGARAEFAGTCMRQHAATTWQRTTAPVAPGETMTLVLAISDISDSILDSYVFLDNFAWGCAGADDPSTSEVP